LLVVAALIGGAFSARAGAQEDIWNCFRFIGSAANPYVEALNCIEKLKPSGNDRQGRLAYDQAEATALSFLGREKEAISKFDRAMGGAPASYDADLDHIRVLPAVDEVVRLAESRQVVMVNEAHHVPQTRWLTLQLLKPLYDRGFRYLAAETFNASSMKRANRLGIPTLGVGFYAVEPVFGAVIREAKRLGFTLVAYEHEGRCDDTVDPVGCQNQREEGEAKNLIERILKKNPSAKILIHAGYGHISKLGGTEVAFPWKPMARYFRERTGIDPLSVDQIEFQMHGRPELEDTLYRKLLGKFSPSVPSVILNDDGSPWLVPPLKGQYDVHVILPPVVEEKGRAIWRSLLSSRTRVATSLPPACVRQRCLTDARFVDEIQTHPVPVDQILTDGSSPVQLYLEPGRYMLRTFGPDGKLIRGYSLKVAE